MIRTLSAGLLIAGGLFLLVSAVSVTYGVLETYADPRLGILDNLGTVIGPVVLGILLGLAALLGGVRLLASARVVAAVALVAVVGVVGACWVAGNLGIEAKERELAQTDR